MKPKKRTPALSKAEIRTQRLDARQRVKDARAVLATSKKAKRAALAEVRARLKAARKSLPAKLAHWREINRQIMRRAVEGERHAVRAEALAARTGTESRAHEMARAANRQIEADLKHLRWLGKARHATPKSSARVQAGLRAAELRAEADDFTRAELPEEMHAAWETHKHRIKAGPYSTRWEAALTFFHRHPHLILEANEAADARAIEATIAREYEERAREEPTRTRQAAKVAKSPSKKASKKKASKKPASKKPARPARQYVASTARELVPEDYSDVPF